MSITNPRVLATNTVIASPAAAAETIIAKLSGVSVAGPDSIVKLDAAVNISIGTAGIAVTLRVYRGDATTDTKVYDSGQLVTSAGDEYTLPLATVDTPGEVAGQDYILTAEVASAAAASTVHNVGFSATY